MRSLVHSCHAIAANALRYVHAIKVTLASIALAGRFGIANAGIAETLGRKSKLFCTSVLAAWYAPIEY